MPGHTNLVRRGAMYYFRSRVPEDLRQHYQRSEFFISLKTRNRQQAEFSLIHLKAKLFDDFVSLRGISFQSNQSPTIERPAPVAPAENNISVWSLVDYWKTQGERRPRTVMEVNTTFERFIQCNGDVPPSRIEKRHVIALKDWMLAEGKSVATVKKAIALLSAIFESAAENHLVETNPAKKIKLPKPKVERKSRVPFDADDLNRIFSSPVFTQGFRPAGGKGEAAYWLPLLGLWTGARLEELGQLLVSDVQFKEGIHFLAISDDPGTEKHVKTTSSRRRVPLHPELLRVGFLDYVEQCRKVGYRELFPFVKSAKNRQRTSSWSQWFGRYLRDHVHIRDRRKVFHSFRHGFKDACRASGIPKEIHNQLTGHVSSDVGDGYGSENYPLTPLANAMAELAYPSVNPLKV